MASGSRAAAKKEALKAMCQKIEQEGRKAFLTSLELTEIDWETTSLTILGKLIEHEAVHKMAGWEELKARLKEDRKI